MDDGELYREPRAEGIRLRIECAASGGREVAEAGSDSLSPGESSIWLMRRQCQAWTGVCVQLRASVLRLRGVTADDRIYAISHVLRIDEAGQVYQSRDAMS